MKSTIDKVLSESGWEIDRITGNSSKFFATAAGQRPAVVYVSREWGYDMLHYGKRVRFHLSAEYWSEGKNALSTSWAFILEDDTVESTTQKMNSHLAQIQQAIDVTYARRLHL
ncbi:hypothetical protein HA052_19795 [Chromobacterium haemolyticum]|uniref:DUF2591 domain-containing protein n=1 Tax=Chromobacterium fluminis TaxID=3044269 RepID=A0ABX0LDW3_9NEIS|nr:hypothetical protein [Chromobacterium haemolyticum]NHR07438.1 hypothetical protein [Chromobacterium haemolyticum]